MLKNFVTSFLTLLGFLLLGAVQPYQEIIDKDFSLSAQNISEENFLNSTITIAAVGDIMMGSNYPAPILPPNDGQDLFNAVKQELLKSDIAIGNLEGPLCNDGETKKDIRDGRNFAFRTPTDYVKNLAEAGFDVLNLANNHSGDFGLQGIISTRQVLNNAGIKYAGIIGDVADLNIRGKKIRVIGFSPHGRTHNLLNIPKAQKIVAALKKEADIVIVTFHGGSEGVNALHTKDTFEFYFDDPRGNLVKFSHAVIDSGADLVLGHGPHVPRALEIYKNRLIAYSLGNFCTYGRFSVEDEAGLSLILKVNLDDAGNFLTGRIIPLYLESPGVPKFDSSARSIELIRTLSQADFPLTSPVINEDGLIYPKNL